MMKTPGFKHLQQELLQLRKDSLEKLATCPLDVEGMLLQGIIKGVGFINKSLNEVVNYKDTEQYIACKAIVEAYDE